MASDEEQTGDQAVSDVELSKPHGKFPPWTRREAYDQIAAMYLDCWDEAAIAREISVELKVDVTAETVNAARIEAAMAAETQPHDVRLRWIYRYSRLTVNNLVKEYMFIEGKERFLQAKRDLAEEIDALINNTPPARLCIAVNDALGRNNIGMDVLQKLQVYARTARKAETMLKPYAETTGVTPEQALETVAARLGQWHDAEGGGADPGKTLAFLASLLKQNVKLIPEEVADYLLDYRRLSQGAGSRKADIASRIADGADMAASPQTALEQIVEDVGVDFPYTVIRRLADKICTGPVLTRRELERVREYAGRHLNDIETMRGLGRHANVPEPVQKLQMMALQMLRKLATQHLAILDHKAFFTENEFTKAAQHLIPPHELQAVLDRFNAAANQDEIKKHAGALPAKLKKFGFPLDRYLEKRFRMPPPEPG